MPLSPSQLAQCEELRRTFTPWKECALALGVNVNTLRHNMYRAGKGNSGKPGVRERITVDVMQKCAALRESGIGWKACGETLGFPWRSLKAKMLTKGMRYPGKLGRVPTITEAVMAEAIKLRAQGFEWIQCGAHLGVNAASLRRAMSRKGIKADGGPTVLATPEIIKKAKALRGQGVCWKMIERELGVSSATIANRMRRTQKVLEEV